MARTLRLHAVAALIICLVGIDSPAFAGEIAPLPAQTAPLAAVFPRAVQTTTAAPTLVIDYAALTANPALERDVAAQRWFGGRRRNDAARTALVLGTLATIAGAAVLVYANRPECSANGSAGGCGYGTKVVGGSVLAAGIFGIAVGAITWR